MAYAPCVSIVPALLALALLSPGPAQSASAIVWNGPSASARVNVLVAIPPVVNLLENHHPPVLAREPGAITAQQRLVLHTNVRQGACVELWSVAPAASAWVLLPVGGEPVSVQALSNGWRLCTMRPGTHTVLIEHRFGAEAAGPWPLRTSATLL
ncbi:MAG: hypothetical protein KF755_05375 [Burkholderiaceae bacterium]|nr:hypothetical protein [Burkholderiaceae bacterium]